MLSDAATHKILYKDALHSNLARGGTVALQKTNQLPAIDDALPGPTCTHGRKIDGRKPPCAAGRAV